jgi:uncharacterized membrane-anchored protein
MFKRPPPYKPQNGTTHRQDTILLWSMVANAVFWMAVIYGGTYFLPFNLNVFLGFGAFAMCALCAVAIEKMVKRFA